MAQVEYSENVEYAFQINDIDFIVPPTNISVHKEGLNYSVKSLRTKSSVKIASGNGVYHAQINLTIPPQEFLSLHRLICQIKNNPFVYVKNSFLKDSLEHEEIKGSGSKHLFFTTMGLNINNHPGAPGSFVVELDLRYFNNKPYIENLGFNSDIQDGDFDIGIGRTRLHQDLRHKEYVSKVSNPSNSKVYVRYSNWLQLEYLRKYFALDLRQDVAAVISGKEIIELRDGDLGLHRVEEKNQIIEKIYRGSKYTVIRNRNFAKLNITEELSETLNKILDAASKNKTGLEAAKSRREALIFHFKEKADKIKGKIKRDTFFTGSETKESEVFNTRELPADGGKYDVVPKEKIEFCDIIKKGQLKIESIQPSSGKGQGVLLNINVHMISNTLARGFHGPATKHLFLPAEMIFKYKSRLQKGTRKKISYTFISKDEKEFFRFYADGELSIHLGFLSSFGKDVIPAGTIIATRNNNEGDFEIEISESLFMKLPIGKKLFEEEFKRQAGSKRGIKAYRDVEKYLSENYQPYMDRKFISNMIYETISDVAFLDYHDYELNAILGLEGEEKIERTGLDVKYDNNTVITGVNGSLRHITPTIPILGQETPTHQFLGSMEPSFQMSLIGVGDILENRMPESFGLLEKNRKNSQINAKKFNEVPDAANFAINSLITKLLGAYEDSYSETVPLPYGGQQINYVKEKFNFSINSVNTFTVEGQPHTYGMNIHFQESRSYKEEEIRPAFTNYDYADDFSGDFFNEVLGAGVKLRSQSKQAQLPVTKTASTPTSTRVRMSGAKTSEYQWMNWKTKHITSEQWYAKPMSYNDSSRRRLGRQGRDISLPFEDEMEKVRKYLHEGDYEGKLWKEASVNDVYVKQREVSRGSKSFIDPDRGAYLLCKTVSTIIDYFELLYPELKGNIKPALTSTLRLSSDKNYMAKRGNHKTGTAVDIDFTGINQTEAGIYIYLMQLLGYLPDLTGNSRTNAYLGMGFYGRNAHRHKVKMKPKDRHWLHLDLNCLVRKYVINDPENGEEFVFHVPAQWLKGFGRCWTSSGYYFDGKEHNGVRRPHIKNMLKRMRNKSEIDSRGKYADSHLGKFGFKTMKEYRIRLEAAHAKLVQESRAATGNKNLVNFWNEWMRPRLIASDSAEYSQSKYELLLPENCGANITVVDNNSGERSSINLKDSDKTNVDWYPASTIKLVAAIGSAYNLVCNGYLTTRESSGQLVFDFKKLGQESRERRSYETLLQQAIVVSDNLSFSLLVAVATRPFIIEWLEEIKSSLVIRYPLRFNRWRNPTSGDYVYSASDKEKGAQFKGLYTNRPNLWSGRAGVLVKYRNESSGRTIPFKHGKIIRGKGSWEGTVSDFSKIMIDYIRRENWPSRLVEKYESLEKDEKITLESENGIFAKVDEYFEAEKNNNAADLQNVLKRFIKHKLRELNSNDPDKEYTIYHKPGFYYYKKRRIGVTSDCLYFSSDDGDDFGVTLWGERIGSYDECRSRAHMIENNFYRDDEHMSLTDLIAYCMYYNGELKNYLRS